MYFAQVKLFRLIFSAVNFLFDSYKIFQAAVVEKDAAENKPGIGVQHFIVALNKLLVLYLCY